MVFNIKKIFYKTRLNTINLFLRILQKQQDDSLLKKLKKTEKDKLKAEEDRNLIFVENKKLKDMIKSLEIEFGVRNKSGLKIKSKTSESKIIKSNNKKNESLNKRLKEKEYEIKDLLKENRLLRKSIPKNQSKTVPKSNDKLKLSNWSKRIRKIGKCDICEEKENLTAHHLWDKSPHPTLKFQDENGVCLCDECHSEFHKVYTNKSQTTPKNYRIFKIKKINQKNLFGN